MRPTRTSPSSPENTPAAPLLLHCCCGPCATACIERLRQEDRPCALYFSNSNLNSEEEFGRRLGALRAVAAHFGISEVVVDPYRHDLWLEFVSQVPGYATLPERGARCAKCFQWSLARTAAMAQARGEQFATSLTVSPHKDSRLLLGIGGVFGHFAPYDFKKKNGFLRSTILSRELGIYRQNYCGCEFSLQQAQHQS
ncbi:MAG: epoxyqueuosine reductase QueH [Lentisphaeria bacterium]|nr:epoxyqueuosine reductase QueH [Lentisphaeria bacterium]